MRRSVLAIGLLTVVAAAFPHSASAATWSVPVDVSSPSTFIDDPFVGFGRSGVGIAAWRWQDGVGDGSSRGVRVASRAASGAFAAQRDAPEAVAPPVVYGVERVAIVSEPTTIRARRQRARVQVTFGRIDGGFGRPKTIATITPFRLPAIAANDAGDIAVAYVRVIGRSRRVVALAVRRRGGRFRRPRIVSRGGANSVAVGIGPRGDVVVAWEREGRIEARVRRRGHRLGRTVRVGSGAKLGTRLRAAVGRKGRVWLAWSSQQASEGGDVGPFTLRTAVTRRGRATFHRKRRLDRYSRRANDEATFDLALDRGDNGFVAWSTFDGQKFRARLAIAGPSGRFTAFETLSAPGYDAAVRDLATSRRRGEAIVVWSRLDDVGEVGTSVLAGYRPPAGPNTGEELVSRGDRARVPAVAFDPESGLPTAVWSQREGPDGPGVPLEQIRTFLRASTRTP
jgi:hypothetical protein